MKSPSHPHLSKDSHSTMNNRFFRFVIRFSGLLLPLVNRTNGTLVSTGRKRSYLLYVPESYNPATPTPLPETDIAVAQRLHQRPAPSPPPNTPGSSTDQFQR